ncbi:MerR family transcriptional regulator [Streptomonospora sp. PA3]|uniref:MerR family transcriptional regulator n=1 Tax=Streptomonospora sp. PA3 TaxID=2607326 RepID=UPI0012DEB83F|nr:MerR family transcriptional regulator [Streptomonospora sp. PA3]MUL42537.1 MerR family transcriptional regulator [Streptomonospora sp. PA3]
MSISQLAGRSGVAASTLRYYDERGLLPARRTRAGYRVYDPADLRRLELIVTAKRLGLPLDEIAELLDVWRQGACAQVKASLRPRLAARLAAARSREAELAEFTATLRGTLDHLDALPDSPGPCGPECDLIDLRHPLPQPAPAENEPERSSPVIACSLESSADMHARIDRWRTLLDGAHREDIADGVRAVLPADRAAETAELAAAEQRCCPFFSFTLHFAHDSVSLDVRAPSDAEAMLDEIFRPHDSGTAADPATGCC